MLLLQRILDQLAKDSGKSLIKYSEAVDVLKKYFGSKKNVMIEQHNFKKRAKGNWGGGGGGLPNNMGPHCSSCHQHVSLGALKMN